VWAVTEGDGWSEEGGLWRATEAGVDTDGWVIFTPSAPMAPGEVVLVTAGAQMLSGVLIPPVSRLFAVEDDTHTKTIGDDPALEELPDGAIAETIPLQAASATYRIAPGAVFDAPVTVWVPVAADVNSSALEVYYFSESPEHRGWYRGGQVIGWMVPGSGRTVVEDAHTFIEIQVNHSGIVQLALSRVPASDAADVGVLVGLGIALAVFGRWRRAP